MSGGLGSINAPLEAICMSGGGGGRGGRRKRAIRGDLREWGPCKRALRGDLCEWGDGAA